MTKIDEILLYKSLAFKYSPTHGLSVDDILEMPSVSEENKQKILEQSKTKNVCVHLPIDFVEELETVLFQLSMSKREFIHLAISDALERFYEISEKHDIYAFCKSSPDTTSEA